VTDGAAAVLITSEDKAHEFTDEPVKLASSSLATGSFMRGGENSLTHFEATRNAARSAYEEAGITADAVDLAEVHDCFSITELVTMEDLGFCETGQAGKFIEDGHTRLDGEIPVNPSGGLIAKGHPVGATGVAQAVEMYEQLRDDAVDSSPRLRPYTRSKTLIQQTEPALWRSRPRLWVSPMSASST